MNLFFTPPPSLQPSYTHSPITPPLLLLQIGVIGFLLVVLLFKPSATATSTNTTPSSPRKIASSTPTKQQSAATTTTPAADVSLQTPPRKTRNKMNELGTTMTPNGRRSARIASRRKED